MMKTQFLSHFGTSLGCSIFVSEMFDGASEVFFETSNNININSMAISISTSTSLKKGQLGLNC